MSWFVIQLKYEAEGHVVALRRDRPKADEHQQSCDDRRWDGNQQGPCGDEEQSDCRPHGGTQVVQTGLPQG